MMLFILPIVILVGYFDGMPAPAIIKYAPELCGMAASAAVLIHAVRHGFTKIRLFYWALIVLIAAHVLFGIIANAVQPGTVIVGGRLYLRTVPFFLLAITFFPSQQQLKRQWLIVFAVTAFQLPVAIYQKVSNYQQALTEGYVTMTGDWVVGTIGNSGLLSLYLIMVSTVIAALYSRKVLSAPATVIALLLTLLPTMINETKATFFLAPLALAIPFLVAAKKNRLKNSIKALFLLVGFFMLFIPVYDYFMTPRWGYGFIEFLTMEGRLEDYLSKDAEVGTTGPVGRLDAMSVAVDVVRSDPSTMAFGLGIGNVTESVLGERFEGEYYSRYGAFAGQTYARLILELGFLGLALILLLLYQVFTDARRLYREPGAYGVVAHAYLAILPIMIFGMMYKDLLLAPAIGVCFWYYCGVIAGAAESLSSRAKAPATQGEAVHKRGAYEGFASAEEIAVTRQAGHHIKSRLR